jgi:hypothetical protein
MRPAVRTMNNAFAIGTLSAPESRLARRGATTQANKPIGTAAAAHTARILAGRHCGISTLEAVASGRAGVVPPLEADAFRSSWELVPNMRVLLD